MPETKTGKDRPSRESTRAATSTTPFRCSAAQIPGEILGAGGAEKFLRAHDANPNGSAAAILPAAASANRSIFYDRSDVLFVSLVGGGQMLERLMVIAACAFDLELHQCTPSVIASSLHDLLLCHAETCHLILRQIDAADADVLGDVLPEVDEL